MVSCELRELLKQNKMSMSELSRRSGIDYVTLQRLAHNRCKGVYLKTIEALCHALHCTPSDLFKITKDH